jgi:hypothetical protein
MQIGKPASPDELVDREDAVKAIRVFANDLV